MQWSELRARTSRAGEGSLMPSFYRVIPFRPPVWEALGVPTPSRLAAARALHAVFGQGNRVPDAWDQGLSPEDAGLAQAMLGLALRHWGRLGAWVAPRLKNPDRDIPLGSKVALALGLVQLAWLPGVSAHAAVNEAVEVAADPKLGFQPHRGLVNAILRKGSADRARLKAELDALPADLDRTPFVERALEAALRPFGALHELEALWARLQVPPVPSFRVLRGEHPAGLEADPQVAGAWRLVPGAEFPRTWLASGAGMVQDRSSQALLSFPWDRPVKRVLDACAAPGGKTTVLAQRWPEAEIFALESDPKRAERLRSNLSLRQVSARITVADATEWMAVGGRGFDLVLVDAPCSGSGTLQKHPELTWIGEGIDLGKLAQRQAQLLCAAAGRVAPGGLLIYAVCSWLPEEGEAHVAAARTAGLRPRPLWTLPGSGSAEPSSVFRPHPLEWEGEGFQAFAFERSEG